MSWKYVFLAVTGCSLAGMTLGGLFGFAAGKVTPDFFKSIIPWDNIEPTGFATFLGATVGVILGGALGAFGISIQAFTKKRGESKP